MPLVKRLPYRRGFTNRSRVEYQPSTSGRSGTFAAGSAVVAALVAAGLSRATREHVKVLGTGEHRPGADRTAHRFSATAREKIEAAGGACRCPRACFRRCLTPSAFRTCARSSCSRWGFWWSSGSSRTCPMPGRQRRRRCERLFEDNQLIGMLDLFSGGALASFSIARDGRLPVHHGLDHHAAPGADHPAPTRRSRKRASPGRNKINQIPTG